MSYEEVAFTDCTTTARGFAQVEKTELRKQIMWMITGDICTRRLYLSIFHSDEYDGCYKLEVVPVWLMLLQLTFKFSRYLQSYAKKSIKNDEVATKSSVQAVITSATQTKSIIDGRVHSHLFNSKQSIFMKVQDVQRFTKWSKFERLFTALFMTGTDVKETTELVA